MDGTRRYRKSALLLLTLILVLEISQYECYPHKRDLNSMPQVINILSDGLREEVKQTDLLANITVARTSSASDLSRVIGLLEAQADHLQNIIVHLEKLSRNSPFTARDYSDIASQGPYRSGTYTISPWDEQGSFKVYCDMDTEGGGWTVIQKRFDGSIDFSRGWEDYKNGFGNIGGEMWLGLDKMNRLTSVDEGSWTLRVELTGFDNSTAYAQYDDFVIGDEATNYALTSLGQYTGTAGDGLVYHLNMAFSTKDMDKDDSSRECALVYKGAWWHKSCFHSNLNGPYLTSAISTDNALIKWDVWKSTALKSAEMKIKLIK